MFNEVIISKQNLTNNILKIKQQNPNSLVCAMVKANAYGVGLKQVVKVLAPLTDFFGVAFSFEAEIVKKLCNNKILVVGALERGRLDSRISYTCHSIADVDYLIKKNQPFNVHLKVNTGMNRFGFNSINDFKLALLKIKNSLINLEGVFTHFATDDAFVNKQMNKFKKYIQICLELGLHPIFHADNSAVCSKFNHHLNMVRIGFNLYNNNKDFLSVVKIKTQITQINLIKPKQLVGYDYRFVADKLMKIAILPIGYADGFSLNYIGLNLNVGGSLCKVLNVCMDCFMLDISNSNLKNGDTVYILDEKNPLSIYAKIGNISEYEAMTRFSFLRAKKIIK